MAERVHDTTLPVRVSSELLEACHAEAEHNQQPLAEWVRRLLYKATKLEEPSFVPMRAKKVRRKA